MKEGIEKVAEGGVASAKGFVAGAVRARMRSDWDKLSPAEQMKFEGNVIDAV